MVQVFGLGKLGASCRRARPGRHYPPTLKSHDPVLFLEQLSGFSDFDSSQPPGHDQSCAKDRQRFSNKGLDGSRKTRDDGMLYGFRN
jgi:hypothetical protein